MPINFMNSVKICIVGPGVVGQATGKVLALHGMDVFFLGGSPEKIKKLQKEGYTAYAKDAFLNGSFDADISILTVPTPTIDNKINLDAITAASIDLGRRLKHLNKYHVVVVKSTVPPGTTENIVIKNIEEHSGKKVGRDFGACMNPEYLREVSAYEDTLKSWLIVIGQYDGRSGDLLERAYAKFACPIHRVTIKEAEMQKYIHNLYNAAKITFFNEMREIAVSMGLSADRLFELTAVSAEGMWNPRYGIKDHGPFDGSCLPKDTQAFYDWARSHDFSVDFLQTVIEVNNTLMRKSGITKEKIIGTRL